MGGAIGLGFLLTVLWRTWGELVQFGIPSLPRLVSAQLLVILALIMGAEAWVCLLGTEVSKGPLVKGFYASQLGKYVPGVIWQPLSQVGLAVTAGVPMHNAAVAFPVHALTQVAAAGTIGVALALFGDHIGPALRGVALAGSLGVLLLKRAWMTWTLELARRWVPKIPQATSVSQQAAIIKSYLWNVGSLTLSGFAFSMMLSSSAALIVTTSAFAVAWVLGFVAVIFPSGIGVREGVLLLAVPAASAAVLAASVGFRLLWVLGELMLILATTARQRFLNRKHEAAS